MSQTTASENEAPVVARRRQRQEVLDRAYAKHPERFVKGPPKAEAVPLEVWTNKPADGRSAG
ncbi:MAG: hypothetical protein LBN38_01855 [Verrucomicrobiota bacterium]|nr:hypothetical protein [Verrucomicrobiota bacterium]